MSGQPCHCGHPYNEHRITAYGQRCAVPCTRQDCYCVRGFALADVPAAVQPLNERNIHPQRRDAQSRRRTWATAMGLRRPHGRLP